MDKLYAKLSEQHSLMLQQKEAEKSLDSEEPCSRGQDYLPSSSSLPITPAAEAFPSSTAPTTRSASATPHEGQATSEELLRLKLELAQAQSKISRLDQQLAHTRVVKPDSGCATPAVVLDSDYTLVAPPAVSPVTSRTVNSGFAPNTAGKMQPFSREQGWMSQDDTRSDISDPLSAGAFNRARGIWNNKSSFGPAISQSQMMADPSQSAPWVNNRNLSYDPAFASSGMDMYRQDRMAPDQDGMRHMGRRGNRYDNRYAQSSNFGGGFGTYNMAPATPYEPSPAYSAGPQGLMNSGMGVGLYSPYQQQPVGTALSPHATEFTSAGTSWRTEVGQENFLFGHRQ